jgi:hypothetical protein
VTLSISFQSGLYTFILTLSFSSLCLFIILIVRDFFAFFFLQLAWLLILDLAANIFLSTSYFSLFFCVSQRTTWGHSKSTIVPTFSSLKCAEEPVQLVSRASSLVSPGAQKSGGLLEGFLEGFTINNVTNDNVKTRTEPKQSNNRCRYPGE